MDEEYDVVLLGTGLKVGNSEKYFVSN